MAKRKIQNPKPKQEGNFWYLRIWQDVFAGGVRTRQRRRIKLAPATMAAREVHKIADELLIPINQVITVGSGVNFGSYVDRDYIPGNLANLASTTRASYEVAIRRHLKPSFGSLCLRDVTPRTVKQFFSGMASEKIPYPTIVKVRDALSSILRSAVEDELILKNPMQGLKLPRDKRPRRAKPFISPEEFNTLVQLVPEPYSTMLFVAVWTGLRVRAGADCKSVQSQMRHSRVQTTLDVYAQAVPLAQRRALEKLSQFVSESVPNAVPLLVQ